MTALSANVSRKFFPVGDPYRKFPVLASAVIYQGAFLITKVAGYALPNVSDADARTFLGIAEFSVTGGATSGVAFVDFWQEGYLFHPVAGVAGTTGQGDVNQGTTIYALDDGTGLTTTSTQATAIGKIVGLDPNSTEFIIFVQAAALRSI